MLTALARLLLAVLTFVILAPLYLVGGRTLVRELRSDDDAARDAHHRLHRERPQ